MSYEEIKTLTPQQLADPLYKFTDIERRAFELRKKGVPPVAICVRLGKKESTVRSLWKRMREKVERVEVLNA